LDKNINKLVSKVFKKEESLSIKPLELPIEFITTSHIELFTIEKDSVKRGYLAVTLANGSHEGGCSANTFDDEDEFADKYEQYYFAAVFNTKGEIIKVKVIEYDSEYGYEIMSRGWLKQFVKKQKGGFEYDKNIDAIAEATVSGESMVAEVNFLNTIMKKLTAKN